MINLHPDEHILAVCRRHWTVFFFLIMEFGVIAGLILVAPFILNSFYPDALKNYFDPVFLGAILVFETLWGAFFMVFADYYLDVWMVTDHNVIFIEQKGVFSRTVVSVNLRNIQDVSASISGLLPTMMRFGDVIIQTASTEGEYVFHQVPDPNGVKDLVLATKEKFLSEISANQHQGEGLSVAPKIP